MFPGGVGSGLESVYLRRGVVDPFMDSVPTSSATGMFSYVGRSTLNADVGEGGVAGARVDATGGPVAEDEALKQQDRMLLRLVYHQQQAIQVQLNTATEWMQQINYRFNALERLIRQTRPPTADDPSFHFSSSDGAAGVFAPMNATAPLFGNKTTAGGCGNIPRKPQPSPLFSSSPADGGREASLGHIGSAPASVYSEQGLQQRGGSSILEGSRACTPPSEQTGRQTVGAGGGSAVASTSRSLESSMAQPWDPHNTSLQSTSGGAAHSRTSSHTSTLGRRANPLLTSSTTVNKLPTSTLRPNWADAGQKSRVDVSMASGTVQTSFSSGLTSLDTQQPPLSQQPQPQSRQPPVVSPPTAAAIPYNSSSLYTSADAAVPPYRRMPPELMPRQTLGRAAPAAPPLTSTTAPNRTSSISVSGVDAPMTRSHREETLSPAVSSSVAASSNHGEARGGAAAKGTDMHDAQGARPNHSGTGNHRKSGAFADPESVASGATRVYDGGARVPSAVNDDSLSDGYGSYESRMYMKNVGLL